MTKLPLLLIVAACSHAPAITAEEAALRRAEASAAYDKKDWATCARANLIAAQGPNRPLDALYEAACCQAQAGERDAALATLGRAVDAGYIELLFMQRDPDLGPLRDDARWQELVARIEHAPRRGHVNAELEQIYVEDQLDRAGAFESLDMQAVATRDRVRRERTIAIVDGGGAVASLDFVHAAFVFQHGEGVADFERAHQLAKRAAELDPADDTAKWLAAAAKDRALMTEGKPQWYGTQFQVHDGKWVLYQVDPAITDAERARWKVPPLALAKKRAEIMSQAK